MNNTADKTILISKKAYNDFTGRIREIFTSHINAPSIAAETLGAFDRYVRGEEISIPQMDRVTQIAFLMIRPDIDKAIARSKAARLRAAARKMSKTALVETVQTAPAETIEPEAPSAADNESPAPLTENRLVSNQTANKNTTPRKRIKHPKGRTNRRQTKKIANIINKNRRKSNNSRLIPDKKRAICSTGRKNVFFAPTKQSHLQPFCQ